MIGIKSDQIPNLIETLIWKYELEYLEKYPDIVCLTLKEKSLTNFCETLLQINSYDILKEIQWVRYLFFEPWRGGETVLDTF